MLDRRPTLVELEAFRATMAEGTTTAAGRRLGRSQSSISRAIVELERRMGKPLFERRGRLIVPTAAAQVLDRSLDPVFAALDGLRHGRADGPEPVEIAVAAPPAFATSLVPRAFALHRREVPNSRLRLEVVSTPLVIEMVAAGTVDLGLTDSQVSAGTVRIQPYCQTPIGCVMPIGHRLARLDRIEVADLRGETFVTLVPTHSMRARIDALLATAGVDQPVSAQASTAVAALALIEAGLGIGLMNPFPLVEHGQPRSDRLACRPLATELTYRNAFVLPLKSPPSTAVRAFQAVVKRLARGDRWTEPCR